MASQEHEPHGEVLQGLGRHNSPSLSGTLSHREDLAQGSGPATAPLAAEGPSPGLPRNVLSERERRRRISASCERLRALLPQFDGRREDMASVLEMAVQFLKLAGSLVPGRDQHTSISILVLAPSKEAWHSLQKNVLQLALSRQILAGVSDPGIGASAVTRKDDPPSCVAESRALTGPSEVLNGPPPIPAPTEPSSLAPQLTGPPEDPGPPPPWLLCSRQLTSPVMSEEAPSWLGQPEPPARAATPPEGPAKEAQESLVPVLDARSVSGSDTEEGTSLLLTASPDWWLGPLDGRGCVASTWALARSSPLDRAEPGLLEDPGPGCQELQDSPLEPWASDLGCTGLALRDEVDGIFPDFFSC
ncbi:spermatogenesis- and oogenesis-specific basic helix-loop-helix-containing protein 1 [Nycticebus coucang]|uniref:spermatogenesis- and oogenesis-specific basic helix-loop-helix-containing protein 1 n=1 Tax=Nycticebus coucang TaxID=9470 RepID=UPI00234D0397|nr:spermatogenesis- and oogenesis-specific basic helix-loop-helix-containing protein 1 [Nycticebus coucang]